MALLVFLLLVVASIIGVVALGLHHQRRLKRRAPENQAVRSMSLLEIAHASLGSVFLFAGIAAYKLAPGSILGSFLHKPYGITVAVLGAAIGLYILGIPIALMKAARQKNHGA
jgi:hypothetical protein